MDESCSIAMTTAFAVTKPLSKAFESTASRKPNLKKPKAKVIKPVWKVKTVEMVFMRWRIWASERGLSEWRCASRVRLTMSWPTSKERGASGPTETCRPVHRKG